MTKRMLRLALFLFLVGALEAAWHLYLTRDLPASQAMLSAYFCVVAGGKPLWPLFDLIPPAMAAGLFIGRLRPRARDSRMVAEVCASAAYVVALAVACWQLPGLNVPWLPAGVWEWVSALFWYLVWTLAICFVCTAGVELGRNQSRTGRQERIAELSKKLKRKKQDHDKAEDREPSLE